LGKGDGISRASYVAQHGRKGSVAIQQNIDVVAGYDRRLGMGFHRRKRGRFSEIDFWNF
jgi:hypothetical protein